MEGLILFCMLLSSASFINTISFERKLIHYAVLTNFGFPSSFLFFCLCFPKKILLGFAMPEIKCRFQILYLIFSVRVTFPFRL
jgi:hypothetical protein